MSKITKVSSDHRAYTRIGYALIVLGLGGFLAWSATAHISAAVIAPGTVAVVSNRKTIQHLEGGIIQALLVRDGSRVSAGEALIRLDPTKAKSELEALQAQLDAGEAALGRLIAERDQLEAIHFPDDLIERAGEPEVGVLIESQLRLFEARRKSVQGELDVLDSRIETLSRKAAAYRKQINSLNSEIASYQEQLEGISSLAAKGYASRSNERELERRILSLVSAVGEAEAEIATAESSMAEAALQKVTVANRFQEEAMSEIAKLREANAGLLERIAIARDVLERTEIKSPQDGIVQGMRFHGPGAVIGAGEPILELVPTDDDLVIEASIPSVSADQIHEGLLAEVRFPSFTSRTTPIMMGKVISISPDALPDPDGERIFFKGRIEVLKETVPPALKARLQPGLPAEVIVPTEERTVLSYLVRPLTDAIAKTFRER